MNIDILKKLPHKPSIHHTNFKHLIKGKTLNFELNVLGVKSVNVRQ